MKQTQISITPSPQITDYIVGSHFLRTLHTLDIFAARSYTQFLIISDEVVFARYGEQVQSALRHLNRPIITSIIPAGEGSKRWETIRTVVQPFFTSGVQRQSVVIALGGGMITDLAGFVASILLRGIDAIYLPTTLLAQVDAAVGGKTGVDYWLDDTRMYKNMIGTIRQPTAVLSDIATLTTLPPSEIQSGLGEVVKYWIGWGKPHLDSIRRIQDRSLDDQPDQQEKISTTIEQCQQIKIAVVQQDPYETRGIRQQLNLGHTIGHGIEAAASGTFSHGQAVALGCIGAARLSVAMDMLEPATAQRIEHTIADLGLPTRAPGIAPDTIFERMRLDKKGGTFVLIRDLGILETGVTVPENIIRSVIAELTTTNHDV